MKRRDATPPPQGLRRRTILQGALGVFGALAVGCGADARDSRTFGTYVVALKSDTPAALSGPEASVFQVKRSIALPLRQPPPNLPPTPPYPRPVWYTPDQLRVQVSYVITNLEDRDLDVELLIDGWNEFIFYAPQVRIVDEDIIPDRSCAQRTVLVPKKGRVEGRVSFDDFERMAIALAGIFNKATNPGHLLDPETNLEESTLARPFIPSTISGITGFDLGLRSRGGAPVRVAVEASVEIIDLNEILTEEGEEATSPNQRPRDLGRREFIPVTQEG